MQWWLTVFFLVGGEWISGDHIDGWGSRVFATEEECRLRLAFAEVQTSQHSLQFDARWVCNPGGPPGRLPASASGARWQNDPWPMLAHWYEPPNPRGLEIFTRDTLSWMAPDGIGLRFTGPLVPPLADDLRRLLLASPRHFNHVVLELDSDGGELAYVRELAKVLQDVARTMDLTTRVMEGSLCASGCIPLFMQGKIRKASGASIWVFHGARQAFTNVPSPAATTEYLELLTAAGLAPGFRAFLEAENRIFKPGSLVLSGYELFQFHKAGVITELLPSWREEPPLMPSGPVPR